MLYDKIIAGKQNILKQKAGLEHIPKCMCSSGKNKNRRKGVSDDVIDCENIKRDRLAKTLRSRQNNIHRGIKNEVCWSSHRNYSLNLHNFIETWMELRGESPVFKEAEEVN